MIERKTKAPQIAGNNLKGHSHAIARMSTNKAIVSQSPEKGKAHHGMLQLQSPMQEVREVWSSENPALPLQEMQSDLF
jgi:hypothetical protein